MLLLAIAADGVADPIASAANAIIQTGVLGALLVGMTGLAILAGSNIVIEASVAQGTASTFNLWGIAAGGTTALEISLGSVDENV